MTRARSWQIREGAEHDTLPARQALDRVRALAPGSPDADLAEGNYLYYARGDYAGALKAFQRLEGTETAKVDVAMFTANVLRRLGRWDDADQRFRDAARLDPENPRAFFELTYTDQVLRRFDQARSAAERTLDIAPDMAEAVAQQIDIALWGEGDSLRARALIPKLRAVARDGRPDLVAADLAYIHRDPRAMELAAHVEISDITFTDYFRHPDGPTELWRARMAWALGDTAQARALSVGLEAALVKSMPVLANGGPPLRDGKDIFGIEGSLHTVRGWVAAFDGDRKRALAEADSAVDSFASMPRNGPAWHVSPKPTATGSPPSSTTDLARGSASEPTRNAMTLNRRTGDSAHQLWCCTSHLILDSPTLVLHFQLDPGRRGPLRAHSVHS